MSLTPAEQLIRSTGLGASEAAPAAGMSKWQTPYQLFRRKLGLDPPDEREDLHLEMGQVLEPVAVRRLEKAHKVTVIDRQLKIVDPANPWRWVTLDGRIAKDRALVEAKSVGMADPAEWGDEMENDQVPMEYYLQCQHGLACVPDAPYTWLPLVVLNRQFRIYRIVRNPDTIELLTRQEKIFLNYLTNKIPPPPQDMEDIALMWPEHRENRKVAATPELAAIVAEFKSSKAEMKALEAKQEEFKLQIASHMGEAAELVYLGKPIVTYKKAKDGSKFDKDRFQVDHPAMFDQYQLPVKGSRRMLTK